MNSLVIFFVTEIGIHSAVFAEIELLSPADAKTTADLRPLSDPMAAGSDEMSIPDPISFSWSSIGTLSASGYTLYLSKDSVLDSSDIYSQAISDTTLNIYNLEIGRQYFWAVNETGAATPGALSQMYTFTTDGSWPRMIYIDGTTNVRDIGGRHTKDGKMIRQGLLFRSAEFNNTQEITDLGLDQLNRLGIVTEINLKMDQENPDPVIPWLRNFIRPGNGMSLYVDGLKETPEVVAEVFHVLAQQEFYPVVIHCRMGSDRTGEIVAMLEAVLGCSDEQIALNYMWSSLSTMRIRDTSSVYWVDFVEYVRSFDAEEHSFEKGSWNVLLSIGVSVKDLETIRNIFLSDDETTVSSVMIGSRAGAAAANRCISRPVLFLRETETRKHHFDALNACFFNLSGRRLLKLKTDAARSGASIRAAGCLIAVENQAAH